MQQIISKLQLLIFLLTISCVAQEKRQEDDNKSLYKGDPLERSAFLKKDLPWFAQFQVGESTVEGFPGETNEEKKQRMQKWMDAKYGLFVHWQPMEALGKKVYSKGSVGTIEVFNPSDFNAEEWVLTAQRLGFKYMVITMKHAGFIMFDSKYTEYDIVDATPFKRDPIKELAEACAKHDFPLGLYYNLRDQHHPDFTEDIGNPRSRHYQQYMLNQVKEMLTNYGPIFSIWFDADRSNSWTVERATEMRDLVRQLQPNIVINNRIGQRRKGAGDYASPERYMPFIGKQVAVWEGCDKFENSWMYLGDNNSQSPEWALYKLCYATSRGGNFLLNLGPTPEGTFLETSVEKLEHVGEWLRVNGESIYEAEKGPHYFLEWGTSTRKGNVVYYQVFDWPDNGELLIPGLKAKIKSASFLADKESKPLSIARKKGDVRIRVPKSAPYAMANVIKVELENLPKVDNAVRAFSKKLEAKDGMREVPTGGYFLPAGFANIHGDKLYFYYGTGGGAQRENLKGWTEESDWAEWDLLVEEKGTYNLEITYASLVEGGTFEITIAGQSFKHTIENIGRNPKAKLSPLNVNYHTFPLGEVKLKPGRYQLNIKPINITDDAKKYHQGLLTLRDITLVPN